MVEPWRPRPLDLRRFDFSTRPNAAVSSLWKDAKDSSRRPLQRLVLHLLQRLVTSSPTNLLTPTTDHGPRTT
jgi:hypothetical protein